MPDASTLATLATLRDRMERRFRDLEIALERLYQAYMHALADYQSALAHTQELRHA